MKTLTSLIFTLTTLFVFCCAFPNPQGGYEIEAQKNEQGQQVTGKVFHDWGSGQASVFGEVHKGQGGPGHSYGGSINQEVWKSDNGRSRAEVFGGYNQDNFGNSGRNYGGRFSHTWGR